MKQQEDENSSDSSYHPGEESDFEEEDNTGLTVKQIVAKNNEKIKRNSTLQYSAPKNQIPSVAAFKLPSMATTSTSFSPPDYFPVNTTPSWSQLSNQSSNSSNPSFQSPTFNSAKKKPPTSRPLLNKGSSNPKALKIPIKG